MSTTDRPRRHRPDATRRPQANSRPPLLVLEPLRGVPRRARPRRGRDRGEPDRRRALQRHLPDRARRHASWCCAARPARRCRRAPTTCCARRACCGRCGDTAGARARGARGVRRTRRRSAAPFYVMERIEGEVIVASVPEALDTPAERRRIGERADRRARRDPRGRLARGGPRGLRQAHRLPGTPAAALHRPVGAQQDARDPGRRERRRVAGREPARARGPATIVHGDYRLGNTIFAAAAARPPGGGARLGDGHDRRPAGRPRLPVHDVDRGRRPRQAACASTSGAVTRAEGFPTRAELIARYEERSGRSMQRHALVHDARAVEERSCSWRATTSARSPARTDDPYLKQFGEGVLELARQAEEVAHGG